MLRIQQLNLMHMLKKIQLLTRQLLSSKFKKMLRSRLLRKQRRKLLKRNFRLFILMKVKKLLQFRNQ